MCEKTLFDFYDRRICILVVCGHRVFIEPGRWIISIHCRAVCNNTFICHKTDHTPRAPLTRSVDLSPSTVPHRTTAKPLDVNRGDLSSDASVLRPTQTGSGTLANVWHAESLVHRQYIRYCGMKTKRKNGQRRGWTGVFVGPTSGIWFYLAVDRVSTSSVYRLRRFAIRRTLRWAAVEFAEFFQRYHVESADRHRFDVVTADVEAATAFMDDEPVYVMGRITIAWRIVRFTRVARREVPSRIHLWPNTPGRILRLTRKTRFLHVI